MGSEHIKLLLEFANVFISLFILAFAMVFLKKTERGEDRKPWMLLFLAILVFLLFEVLSTLGVFTGNLLPELAYFLKTLFIGLILYVFVYQYHLLTMSGKVLIRQKKNEQRKTDKTKRIKK